MTIAVLRLDDRLVHGQVVVGWGNSLGINKIVLVDDKVRQTEWEQELYSMGVPQSMSLEFASVDEARDLLSEWQRSSARIVVLVGDVDTLVRLCSGSRVVTEVNIGGVHNSEDRTERLTYVFLTREEYESLRQLEKDSIKVTAQDVPSTRPVPLGKLS